MFNKIPLSIKVVLIVISSGISINLGKTIINTYQTKNRLIQIQNQIDSTTDRIKGIQDTFEKQNSEQYIEQQAREQLNLVKPGEKIVIIDPGKFTNLETGVSETNFLQESSQNWEKWKNLFLSGIML